MITIQVRRYNTQGVYDHTINVEQAPGLPNYQRATLAAWLSPHAHHELALYLQTTPCNIMVRRNGKLISYKELLND